MWDWRGHSHNIILKGGSESVIELHIGCEKDWVLERKWEGYFFLGVPGGTNSRKGDWKEAVKEINQA